MSENIKVYDWADEQGIIHKVPEGSCVICEHCTDIYLDPWHCNRIYACLCEIHDESKSRECDDFKLRSDIYGKCV